jgi:antitoxin (DNA-binding transcriptional repressor) of toxin-antitoxin stability system
MRNTYSLYEAKAKLSAIVRKVREGQPVIVTLNGEPVVEIRAIQTKSQGIEARLKDLEERGILAPAENRKAKFKIGPRVPGALKRFLEERD